MSKKGKKDKKGGLEDFEGIPAVPATDLRKDAAGILGRVEYGLEDIILTRHGKPAAALVPLAALRALREYEDAIDIAAADAALRDVAKHGTIPWAEVKRRNGL